MYPYRNPYEPNDQRFLGWAFGLPLLGGFLGGALGSSLFARPFYGGYPGFGFGYPGIGYPGMGFGGSPFFY